MLITAKLKLPHLIILKHKNKHLRTYWDKNASTIQGITMGAPNQCFLELKEFEDCLSKFTYRIGLLVVTQISLHNATIGIKYLSKLHVF